MNGWPLAGRLAANTFAGWSGLLRKLRQVQWPALLAGCLAEGLLSAWADALWPLSAKLDVPLPATGMTSGSCGASKAGAAPCCTACVDARYHRFPCLANPCSGSCDAFQTIRIPHSCILLSFHSKTDGNGTCSACDAFPEMFAEPSRTFLD